MIFKSSESQKINISKINFLLFYGNNEGAKEETINKIFKDENFENINKYEEKEILENPKDFFDGILSKSLFEKEKVIVIKRVTEKLYKIIEEVDNKKIDDIKFFLNAGSLEKKSKLRNLFEKNKNYVCITFYPDNEQTLSKIASIFFKEKQILISSENINLIVNKCGGDRENLNNELTKIEYFCKNKKKISTSDIIRLINLSKNFSISDLVENCLAQNKKKIVNILNENNFAYEDCILITRALLYKSKRILVLSNTFKINKNIELTISSARPPIFWKEKEITKQQILKWPPEKIRGLIYKLNKLELDIKKNLYNSINLVSDFILDQASVSN